jgi:hypothetical protein
MPHDHSDKTKHKRDVQQRKPSHSLRIFSFITTIALIFVIVGASYYSALPKVEHIPDSVQFQTKPWMAFVPRTAVYASYVDYSSVLTAVGDPLFFGNEPILEFYQLHLNVDPVNVFFEVGIQLPASANNVQPVTISVLKLRADAFNAFVNAVAQVNLPKPEHDGYTLLGLVINNAAQHKLTIAHVAIVADYLVVSTNEQAGRYGVEAILDQYSSKGPSLFSDISVQRGVYAAGAADQPYVALFVGSFQTQFNNTRMTVKSILQDGGGVRVTRSILFPSSDEALSQIGKAHNVYQNANSYRILDEWLVISYNYPLEKLRGELTGL